MVMESGYQAKLMLREGRRRLRSPGYFQPLIDALEASRDGPRIDVQCLGDLFVRLALCNMREEPQIFLRATLHRRARCGRHSIPNPLEHLFGQAVINHRLSSMSGLNALRQYLA